MGTRPTTTRFEALCLIHLDAAHNLARWLVGGAAEAEDLVQEAYLRAWKSFDGFRGGDSRAWILAIVRNTCMSWLGGRGASAAKAVEFDEVLHTPVATEPQPERWRAAAEAQENVAAALRELAPEFREVVVLREFEGLSYKEIGTVTGAPLGTVMSRLARARARLAEILGTGEVQPHAGLR